MDEVRNQTQAEPADEPVATPEPVHPYSSGIYRTPVVGRYLRETREFADGLRPTEGDSWGVRTGKNLVRGGIIAGTTGAVMVAVL